MTAVLVGRFAPLSPEWHAARRDCIGGSEIAAVLGLSKWQSPFSLWHSKFAGFDPQPDNDAMEWGRRLEPVVVGKFLEAHPEYARQDGGTFTHPERTWQLANPDELLINADPAAGFAPVAILEAKTALYGDEWGTPGTDEIPPYYLLQCRWYMDVLDLDVCHVAVLIGGHDYREYVVRADTADTELMRSAGAAFIASLTAGTPPDLDGHTETYVAVRKIHPGITPVDVEIPPLIAAAFIDALTDFEHAETQKRLMTSTVADLVGDGRRAVCAGQRLAIRVPGRNGQPPYLKAERGLTKESAA